MSKFPDSKIMIFNSFNFLILFPLLFLLYYLIPAEKAKVRNGYLLLVSYLLYANWKPAYALILLAVTTITFLFAGQIEVSKSRVKIVVGGGIFDIVAATDIQVL